MENKIKQSGKKLFSQFIPIDVLQDKLSDHYNKLFLFFAVFGTIGFLTSFLRIIFVGFRIYFIAQTAVYFSGLIVLLSRKFVRLNTITAFIVGIITINALLTFSQFRLASVSLLMFSCITIFISNCYNIKKGYIAFIISIFIAVLAGVLDYFKFLPPIPSISEYFSNPISWASQITTYVLFVFPILFFNHTIQKNLFLSIKKNEEQVDEVKAVNLQLEKEVAERRRIEKEFLENENRYRFLAENMIDVLFIQDMSLNLLYFSPSAEKLFGYTKEESAKLTYKDILTEESLKRAFEDFKMLKTVAEKGRIDVPLAEYEYIKKDGKTFWGELKCSFLYNDKNELSGVQGVLRDITQRKKDELEKKKLEEELRHSEKMRALGQLVGGIAHDFNNQLTVILNNAMLLKLNNSSRDENSDEYINYILKGADNSSELIKQLLVFARKEKLSYKKSNIDEIVKEVINLLSRSVDKAINFNYKNSAEKFFIRADNVLLQNALLNIAINARDAIKEKGKITFKLENVLFDKKSNLLLNEKIEPGEYIKITVSDTGRGIDKSDLKHIFEPFFTTKESGKGTGMGLATVYGIVKTHKGFIDVSTELGKGTDFILYFPVFDEYEESSIKIQADDKNESAFNILVVDDDPDVLHSTKTILKHLNHTVFDFTNGNDAIEFYKKESDKIHFAFIDINMPVINGREVFIELHKINPGIKAFIVSGYNPSYINLEDIKNNVAGFISKPYNLETIEKILK